jgi:PIN domain nuclease of toxin-antitoxin system
LSNQYLLDASAVLALLANEPGADHVRPLLPSAVMTSLNLAEVVKKLRERAVPPDLVEATISDLQIPVRSWPSDTAEAIRTEELAASVRAYGLSLGDCVCLAAAEAWDRTAVTAERRWREALPDARIANIR